MKQKTKTNRRPDQLRPIKITRNFIDNAHGAVLFEMGKTRVLCTASLVSELPKWRKEDDLAGWITAEYNMLPASTQPRKSRPATAPPDGRSVEIKRLLGRTLRAVVDLEKLGPYTIYLDCHVLQADGSTRTAAVNGAYIALVDAIQAARDKKQITENPILGTVSAVSVGIVNGKTVLDLDYQLDRNAQVDLNIAMTHDDRLIEIQGAAEQQPFSLEQLDKMITLAKKGIKKIRQEQKKCLRKT